MDKNMGSILGGSMKIGDLCTCSWADGLFVFLGEGGWEGWYILFSLKTGKKTQYSKFDFKAVKKTSTFFLTNRDGSDKSTI
jgi:hypothetical protein